MWAEEVQHLTKAPLIRNLRIRIAWNEIVASVVLAFFQLGSFKAKGRAAPIVV